MVITGHKARSKQDAFELALSLAAEKSQVNGRCTLLVPSFDETVRTKHVLAERGWGFGVTVTTPKGWMGDLWELFGDGRAIAGSVDRAMFVRRALKDYLDERAEAKVDTLLSLTAGTEALVERLVRDAASEVVRADKDPSGYLLSDTQGAAVHVAAQARRTMARFGLVEHARACDLVREWGVASEMSVVALGCDFGVAEERLLDAVDAEVVEIVAERASASERVGELNELVSRLYAPDFDDPIESGGAVRFAYPAGEYASDQVIADEIASVASSLVGKLRVAIATPAPLELFESLAPRLVDAGARVKVSCTADFVDTPFGRAWKALLEFALDERRVDVARAGDFSLSGFSAIGLSQAYALDARFRGWRGETVDEALTDLTAYADDDWRAFMSSFAEGEISEALDAQARWIATRLGWPEAYRSQQLRAVKAAKGIHARAESLGLDLLDELEVLSRVTMPYEAEVEGVAGEGSTFEVEMGTMAQMAVGPSLGYDVVVLEGLDAQNYPLKDEETSVDAVLQALGAWKPARRVERLRLRFEQVVAQAKSCVILHRTLNTVDAEESRPAALVEELVDCYRAKPSDPEEVDKVTGLTTALRAWCRTQGEEDLSRLLDPQGKPMPLDRAVDVYSSGYLAGDGAGYIVTPGHNEAGGLLDEAVLSASAIECYLECPYKWFTQRRLRIESIDADFGPIAFGNFAHKVLESLHEQLRITGLRRVKTGNLAECDRLLDWRFDAQLEEEQGSYRKDALIPCSQLDLLEIDTFRRRLHDYLRFEATLLPDFEPWKHEVRFGYDVPFEYAGVKIRGSIDRVDVDAGGRAVIIDYKGSVGDRYHFRAKDAEGGDVALPRKVQALVYAQVVRRLFGLEPVAAVYVSYGKNPGIAGLYDELVLHPDHDLGGMRADRCGTTDMLEVLDRCEEMVAERIARMKQGELAPCPCDKDACAYCPVVQCEVRDGIDARGEA